MRRRVLIALAAFLVFFAAVLAPAVAMTRVDVGGSSVPTGTSGTNWTAIGSGIGAGAVAVLVVGGAVYVTRHGGWHMPHRPVHTH